MIDLYTWTTPNGEKPLIALEELGIPYQLHWVNISKGEQMRPEYLAINPNNKIPAIVDSEGPGGPLAVFESGAILLYLAEKAGRFLPEGAARWAALEWIFFQVGGTGPMFGQLAHFVKFAKEKIPYAIDRYTAESQRLLGVLETRLSQSAFLAGNDYSIADMQNVTWVRAAKNFGLDVAEQWPHVAAWVSLIEARPAVAKALALKPPQ